MEFVIFVMRSIMVTTVGGLHANGIYEIQTAKKSCTSTVTISYISLIWRGMKVIFVIGIIGTGLLTITVLIGTCVYVISDLLGWKEGLSKKFSQARLFYFIILIATIIGLIINYMTPINPIQILIYAATINTVF